jgi:hypothetical protein
MSKDVEMRSKCDHDDCSKKLKLTDFSCKCGKTYCKNHRPPEEHKCEYDYKEKNNKQKKIEELECKSCKIQKI